jgi:hypothetical protein
MKPTRSGEPFTINIKMIRKRPAVIGRNKSMGPDGVPGRILKLGGEAVIPYLALLLDVTVNNATIPSDWKRATVVPMFKAGRSICCHKLQTSQLNLSGLQTNGKRHSGLPKASLGYK